MRRRSAFNCSQVRNALTGQVGGPGPLRATTVSALTDVVFTQTKPNQLPNKRIEFLCEFLGNERFICKHRKTDAKKRLYIYIYIYIYIGCESKIWNNLKNVFWVFVQFYGKRGKSKFSWSVLLFKHIFIRIHPHVSEKEKKQRRIYDLLNAENKLKKFLK